MALGIKRVGPDNIQVEEESGHWIMFTLDALRSRSTLVNVGMIEGAPPMAERDAELFAWAAFAAARGYAVEHGLIEHE